MRRRILPIFWRETQTCSHFTNSTGFRVSRFIDAASAGFRTGPGSKAFTSYVAGMKAGMSSPRSTNGNFSVYGDAPYVQVLYHTGAGKGASRGLMIQSAALRGIMRPPGVCDRPSFGQPEARAIQRLSSDLMLPISGA